MGQRVPTDLNNIRFFVEVVNAGSFSAAARSSSLPPSTVSRRMARLEDDLGARLLQRTTRSLRLTDAGQTYLAHAQRALDELEVGRRAMGELQASPRGRVRLTAPSGFAEALWSVLPRFLDEHPEVRLELDLTERYVDLVEEGFDLAVRSSHGSTSALVGRRFGASVRQLFANPTYLGRRGLPRSIQDLTRHDCVILGARSDRATWTLGIGAERHKVTVRGRVAVNEARLAARCAASGFGVALLPRALCEEFLASGELRQILPRVTGGQTSLWLVYPDRRLPAAARAVADFLARELAVGLPSANPAQL